ncbi:Uncharacterized protein Rs2_31504 [Raphanus sativus]|nr:Uncharacterized protein Rs2_31504 [Raphanus sativus]
METPSIKDLVRKQHIISVSSVNIRFVFPTAALRMGTLVIIAQGVWEKSPAGVWMFVENLATERETVLINPKDRLEGLVEMIRIRLDLGVLTPVVLTYQLPEWMLDPEGPRTPPMTLATNNDVETMLSVTEYMTDKVMYVTSGPELVAKYQFLCRTPFKIGGRSFLGEGVTEEQHHQAIKDLVGGHPIICSKSMLEIMFNEPQLLIVYRVALEIELVYAPTPQQRDEFPRFTVDDAITILEGENPYNNGENINVQSEEVLQGEPMDMEQLQREFPNIRAPTTGSHGEPLDVQPLRTLGPYEPLREDESAEEQAYWNGVFEAERIHQVNVSQAPRHTNGALGLPIGPNQRVTAPPTPNTVLVGDEEYASYTGSSDGLNDGQNNNGIVTGNANTEDLINITDGVAEGAEPAPVENGSTATRRSNNGPNLDLTLGIGINNNHGSDEIIDIKDSDSEADGESGGFGFPKLSVSLN